jgi:hypothetical protein
MRLAVSVMLMVCIVLAGCGRGGNPLIGKWQDEKGVLTFEFKSDGQMTMTMSVPGIPQPPTRPSVPYKVQGDKLTIGGESSKMPEMTQRFAVSGDTLTLGAGDHVVELKRAK